MSSLRMICVAALLSMTFAAAKAQATKATAIRKADLQVGGYFTLSPKPDYGTATFFGPGFYLTYDFSHNLGIEFNFKQLNTSEHTDVYERSYEIGPRYVRHFGIFDPYVRASYGRGVFNYVYSSANLAYNIYSGGIGADIRVQRHINVRADGEYQVWSNFPPSSLTPIVLSGGVAYHF